MAQVVICPYCGHQAKLCDSAAIYRGQSYGLVYLCPGWPQCDSYVGVHKGTDRPLGRMANAELRRAKVAAHAAFDPLWRARPSYFQGRRNEAYDWLARELGIMSSVCHIGMMDVAMCRAVVRICKAFKPRKVMR